MLLLLAIAVCIAAIPLLYQKWRAWRLESWVRQQLDVASFRYAGSTSMEDRLRLRAAENRRLKAAFGIENSLTTESRSTHQAFRSRASRLVDRKDRSWLALYSTAEAFIQRELATAAEKGQSSLPLAESVRCMVLAVVLLDSFNIDPAAVPRATLVTITEEINNQWLESKCHPDEVVPSERLNSAIASLSIRSPFKDEFTEKDQDALLTPAEVLSILMPQYETLWRVVLLTFVSAYHRQPAAYHDAVQRTADVPACLGDPAREGEALKLAKEGLRLFPSNKHLYRAASLPSATPSPPGLTTTNTPRTLAADISALHRHPQIWSPSPLFLPNPFTHGDDDALAFRPSRFDAGALTPLQRRCYVPFSTGPHRCPAGGGTRFGERMVVLLVVALGRGRVVAAPVTLMIRPRAGGELPTGRDAMEGWRFEFGPCG
ncbi:uncharacterized protein THITE_159055 [Thermothielavioides terrestris NRRL 8126]|uniref:Cytochrome P450 n=1 Tax=Thermothielavioides terrestris (strain ATCC 38088 / NRRL 8126) TaxID=578455 RepID=G2RHH7_THETT|nr:uncharacterized protein THITE_159055 [Thermothielavioides terrestris NRRL 8126]AEO71289.1 hypothetical protein THITE_159055 [Thermothielavioides terrestris NRRL 8126]